MSRNIVIALSGFKQSGKDTVADFIEDYLTEDFKYAVNVAKFERGSFATNIRSVVSDIFSIKETDIENKDAPIDYLKKYFNGAKKSYRDLVILIGESMKEIVNKNVWTYSLENKIRNQFKNPDYKNGDNIFIITDVRYATELQMLNRMRKRGVEVYHYAVFRKETMPEWVKAGLRAHEPEDLEIIKNDFNVDHSEYEWCAKNPKMTDYIPNDSTKADLKELVEQKIMKRIWK